jgi:hypothetical protein
MLIQLQTQNAGVVNADTLPGNCPVCLRSIQPLDWGHGYVKGEWIDKVFQCPACMRLFIARYKGERTPTGMTYKLNHLLPVTIATSEHSDVIKVVSPDFVTIFGEAEVAEKHGLKLICGPGYRKALEFLIKDYVIGSHKEKADEIKKLNLAKCITDYVSDGKVKQVAARAVWLGNDETHYERKWEDKDLNDLKNLIRLTLHWIEMDELTTKALKEMPEGKH